MSACLSVHVSVCSPASVLSKQQRRRRRGEGEDTETAAGFGRLFVQAASSFQYENRSRAELLFDHLKTSTPTYESGETKAQEPERFSAEEVSTSEAFRRLNVPQVSLSAWGQTPRGNRQRCSEGGVLLEHRCVSTGAPVIQTKVLTCLFPVQELCGPSRKRASGDSGG